MHCTCIIVTPLPEPHLPRWIGAVSSLRPVRVSRSDIVAQGLVASAATSLPSHHRRVLLNRALRPPSSPATDAETRGTPLRSVNFLPSMRTSLILTPMFLGLRVKLVSVSEVEPTTTDPLAPRHGHLPQVMEPRQLLGRMEKNEKGAYQFYPTCRTAVLLIHQIMTLLVSWVLIVSLHYL